MSLKQFTQQDNITMLWDVISDEEIFRFLTPDLQQKIHQLFINNIKGFFESEKTKTTTNSLVDLNKKYIILILNHIKKTYPYQPNKIKIHNDQIIKESITYEEIQNDRRTQFERDLIKRQSEFESSMTIKAPPVPEFAETQNDNPIKEMDKILKEMQSQRNYEVEQINRTYNTSCQADNWLKPQETSLKNEKININEETPIQQTTNRRFKFLNDLDKEISPTNTNNKKNVSFSNNNDIKTFNIEEEEEDDNIFSKLKKLDNKENIKIEIEDQDRISKLERNFKTLNEKMDKILDILNNRN
jgi:hypothetical protein